MNPQTLNFRFTDSHASGGSPCSATIVAPTAPAAVEVESGEWMDEEMIMDAIRQSVRTGRPVAEICRAMRRA